MEITFDGDLQDINVIEHVIRDVEWDLDEERNIQKPHFQARIEIDKKCADDNFDCSITYYDDLDKFLGLDDSYNNIARLSNGLPSSFSTPLNIPSGTKKMVVIFTKDKNSNFWFELSVGTGVILVLISLAAWAITSVGGLFGS